MQFLFFAKKNSWQHPSGHSVINVLDHVSGRINRAFVTTMRLCLLTGDRYVTALFLLSFFSSL